MTDSHQASRAVAAPIDGAVTPAERDATRSQAGNIFRVAMPLASFVWLIGGFALFHASSAERAVQLTREDGLFQVVTAVALAAGSVLAFIAYRSARGEGLRIWRFRTRRNPFYLGLAMVLFMACGEEISWGQHVLGYSTPGFIAERNEQGELNIHNLSFFDARVDGEHKTGFARQLTLTKMFSAFTLGLGVVLPLAHALLTPARRVIEFFHVPVAPVWLSLFLLSTWVTVRFGPELPLLVAYSGALSEVREAMYAWALLVVAAYAAWATHHDPGVTASREA